MLVDFDGTISTVDVTDRLIARYATDPTWKERDQEYMAGRSGSRDLLAWDLSILGADRATLEREAATQSLDETFPDLVRACRLQGAAVEVVSDGLGFHIEPALRRLGLDDLPVATSAAVFPSPGDEEPARLTFPFGHDSCFVCGTCKRERVLRHQAAGRVVVFVGDGVTDRFAAAHADIIFAKAALASICGEEGWAFRAWDRFAEIRDWLVTALDRGDLPGRRQEVDAWRARSGRPSRAFICGPEVWGPGRRQPGQLPGR